MQVLASFSANFLFPMFAAVLVVTGISLNLGGIVLMALGSQWYILFNDRWGQRDYPTTCGKRQANLRLPQNIAVAQADPARHLPELCYRRHNCRRGSVERVDRGRGQSSYRGITLTATGLGAYIRDATGGRGLRSHPRRA